MRIFISSSVSLSITYDQNHRTEKKELNDFDNDWRVACFMTFYGRNVLVQAFFIELNTAVFKTENYFLLVRFSFPYGSTAGQQKIGSNLFCSKFLEYEKEIRYFIAE